MFAGRATSGAGPRAGRACDQCGATGVAGYRGDAGTDWANHWFCTTCWEAWEEKICWQCGSHSNECQKTASGVWLCERCTKEAEARREAAAARRASEAARRAAVADDGPKVKCARADCPYVASSALAGSFCCQHCEAGNTVEPHGLACARRHYTRPGQKGNRDLEGLPLSELRQECKALGVDLTGCVEKGDMVNRLRSALEKGRGSTGAKAAAAAMAREAQRRLEAEKQPAEAVRANNAAAPRLVAAPAAVAKGISREQLESASVRDLRQLCEQHGVDLAGCVEKAEILGRIKSSGKVAPASSAAGEVAAAQEASCPLIDSASSCPAEEEGQEDLSDSDEEIDMDAAWQAQTEQKQLALQAAAASAAAEEEASSGDRPAAAPAAAPAGPPSLHVAVESCDLQVVRAACARPAALVALNVPDDRGRRPLQICAASAAAPGAAAVAAFLVERSAEAEALDGAGRTALELAVSAALEAGGQGGRPALDTVRVLLDVGVPPALASQWRRPTCPLADWARTPSGEPVFELLQSYGLDLPWHPDSLMSGAYTCNLQVVQRALKRLGGKAEAAIHAKDSVGWSPLHICSQNAANPRAAEVVTHLLQQRAQVEARNAAGDVPLGLAVASALTSTHATARTLACLTISALVAAGVPEALALEWRSAEGSLAQARGQAAAEVVDLLLKSGVDLPWHRHSLRSAVLACRADGVNTALLKLGAHAEAAVQLPHPDGASLLHSCAAAAGSPDAAQICRTLIQRRARPDVKDGAGRRPIELAVEAALSAADTEGPPALRTLQVLLEAGGEGAGPLPDAWRSADSALALAATEVSGAAVVELLIRHGIQLPWYDWVEEVKARCAAKDIPLAIIGRQAAWNVLRDCERLLQLGAEQLAAECQTRRLGAEDNGDREEMQNLLLQARILEELTAVEAPDSKLLGTWCYGGAGDQKEYNVSRLDAGASGGEGEAGTLQFRGLHAAYGMLWGMLQPGSEGWLCAELVAEEEDGLIVGDIRLLYSEEDRTMLSHFRSKIMAKWGRGLVARKAMAGPSPGASPPSGEEVGRGQGENHGAACDHPGAADADLAVSELQSALCKAVEELDPYKISSCLALLRRGVVAADGSRAPLERVSQPDEDGNTMLHRCCAVAVGAASKAGCEIASLLIEAQGSVNAVNLIGESPLLTAVRAAGPTPLTLVQALLTAQASPDCTDALTGDTALLEATCRGESAVCRALLEAGADPKRVNTQGNSARDLATQGGHEDVLRLLRALCPSEEDLQALQRAQPLWAAVHACKPEDLQQSLTDLGEIAEALLHIPAGVDAGGASLLHVAAGMATKADAAEIVRLLLQESAPADALDLSGRTPLAVAVAAGLASQRKYQAGLDLARALLVGGASVEPWQEAWQDPEGELARSASSPIGVAYARLLCAFGARLPWYEEAEEAESGEEEQRVPLDRDAVQEECSSYGVPRGVLGWRRALEVLRKCRRWRKMRAQELRVECDVHDVAVEDCIEVSELVSRLLQMSIWGVLPAQALAAECIALGAPLLMDEAPRSKVEAALRAHVWGSPADGGRTRRLCTDKGIPLDRMDLQQAAEVLERVLALEEGSIGDTKKEYMRWRLEVEVGMEKQDMVNCLKQIFIWQALPVHHLRAECEARGIKINGQPNQELVEQLVESLRATQRRRQAGAGAEASSRYRHFFDFKGGGGAPPPAGGPEPSKPPPRGSDRAQPEEPQNFKSHFRPGAAGAGFRPNFGGGPSWRRDFGGGTRSQQQQRPPPPERPQQGSTGGVERHFLTLGLPSSASEQEVRRAYRKLALQHHPDKTNDPSAQMFREVREAYDSICEFMRLSGRKG